MAKFCTKCGKPLDECTCEKSTVGNSSFFASLKNRMGIGEPETNNAPLYEKNMQIVPENISANDGEIPIKQYNVATLRNRFLGITISKAIGRLQITNKRVIFRAAGRCLRGRTTIQQEFSIDEIAGADVRREYSFTFWDILIGIIIWAVGGFIGLTALGIFPRSGSSGAIAFFNFLFGTAALLPFFLLHQKFGIKLLALGASSGFYIAPTSANPFSHYASVDFFFFFAAISIIISLICLVIFAIKPNLVLTIKTKSSSEAIDIQKKNSVLPGFGASKEEHTGYAEVLPAENVEVAIKEVCAIISDIQRLGDFGIEKWKS